MPRLQLWVLSAPLNSCAEINNVLLGFGLSGTWLAQPAREFHYQLQLSARLRTEQVALLVSELSKAACPFEVETTERMPERYLHYPGLGILRQQLNEAGEVLLREDAVQNALQQSQGSGKDFERRLRLLSGTPWLDLMEPYRNHEGVRVLPRAV